MLLVLGPLVSYGFFNNPNKASDLIEILLKILDGRSDRPAIGMKCDITSTFKQIACVDASKDEIDIYQKEARYENNEKNKQLFRVKATLVSTRNKCTCILFICRAVEVLHLFFKLHCYYTNSVIINVILWMMHFQ